MRKILSKTLKNGNFLHADMWGDRFLMDKSIKVFDTGLAEASLLNIATGMYLNNKTVYIYGVSNFLIHRLEQLKFYLKKTTNNSLKKGRVIIFNSGKIGYEKLSDAHQLTNDNIIINDYCNIPLFDPDDIFDLYDNIDEINTKDIKLSYIRLGKDYSFQKIGCTGSSGFIANGLKKYIDIIPLNRRFTEKDIKDLDIILLMSSPSDIFDFGDKNQTAISMIDDYVHNLNIIKKLNKQVIFTSSIAVETDENIQNINDYTLFKATIERYLIARNIKHYTIRVPRVYGKKRQKGLMKQIKNGIPKKDLNKNIEFIDIKDYSKYFAAFILTPNDKTYKKFKNKINKLLTIKTISEIKNKYKL